MNTPQDDTTQSTDIPEIPGLTPSEIDELEENLKFTQATHLPPLSATILPPSSITRLEGESNFHIWLYRLSATLRLQGLRGMVSKRIPRPQADDQNYVLWLEWAARVLLWLNLQVSDEIVARLVLLDEPPLYPDDFICAVTHVLLAGESGDILWEIHNLRSKDYPSVMGFVFAVRNRVCYAISQGLRQDEAYQIGSSVLLRQLRERFPRFGPDLRNTEGRSQGGFLNICRRAIDYRPPDILDALQLPL